MFSLEVFFDYICPYCLRAHDYLLELIPNYPDIDIIWRPCESHPRPERFSPHSDLIIQGMFFALDCGADLLKYNSIMYKAALQDKKDIEDAKILSEIVGDFLDPDDFYDALKSGKYLEALFKSNQHAFNASGVWVLPAYRMNGKKLDSIEGVGVTKSQLKQFLDQATIK